MQNLKRFLVIFSLNFSLLLLNVPIFEPQVSANPAASQNSQRPAPSAQKPTRRALLIGINNYTPPIAEVSGKDSPKRTAAKPQEDSSPTGRGYFCNLDGPKNDVQEMKNLLLAKFDFEEKNISVIEDEKATRNGILQALKDLFAAAKPGDSCLFFYAGHGSRVRNTRGGEPDNYDESLVPYDSNKGAPDIRDKELARLFIAAIKKGVRLTVIADSCHSGSIARGQRSEVTRGLPFIETDIHEEPGFKPEETPEKNGALILSGAKDEQTAGEAIRDGHDRGNFTWALIKVLKQPFISPNEPADRVFQRVSALMASVGMNQQPVMATTEKRKKEPLFGGTAADTGDAMTAAVSEVKGKIVKLQGGIAIGLSKGCELKEAEARKNQTPVRLAVTNVTGLSSCEAVVVAGEATTVKPGMLFVLDRWVSADSALLKVWIPPTVTPAELSAIGGQIQSLRQMSRLRLIEDPTQQTPQALLYYDQGGWVLHFNGRDEKIGMQFTAEKVAVLLPEKTTLFVNVPPTAELRGQIKIGKGTRKSQIEVSEKLYEAIYILAGRALGDHFAYAWIRPEVTEEEAKKRDDKLPVRTDWHAVSNPQSLTEAAGELERKAVILARISGWLQLQAPLNDLQFPYRLALEKVGVGTVEKDANGEENVNCGNDKLVSKEGAGTIKQEGRVTKGECYSLALIADKGTIARALQQNGRLTRKYIYIFTIDSSGKASLLYPGPKGGVENYFPIDPKKPEEKIVLQDTRISFLAPYGMDTYILLASDEELPDPFVFETQSVIARGDENRRGNGQRSLLEDLIDDVNTGTRAASRDRSIVPLTFSIDRMFLRSQEKP